MSKLFQPSDWWLEIIYTSYGSLIFCHEFKEPFWVERGLVYGGDVKLVINIQSDIITKYEERRSF